MLFNDNIFFFIVDEIDECPHISYILFKFCLTYKQTYRYTYLVHYTIHIFYKDIYVLWCIPLPLSIMFTWRIFILQIFFYVYLKPILGVKKIWCLSHLYRWSIRKIVLSNIFINISFFHFTSTKWVYQYIIEHRTL